MEGVMKAFMTVESVIVPMDRANVDTDAIIPKQYLKSIYRNGFGANLFDDWRYLDPGEPYMDHSTRRKNSDCVLNQQVYEDAEILIARENFGCGSSREHAVWALIDYGIRVVIAPSFADIFFNNTLNNGLLAITLDEGAIEQIFKNIADEPGYTMKVDLQERTISDKKGWNLRFELEEYRRRRLLNGLDDIGVTLQYTDEIKAYERRRRTETPWLFK